MDPLDGLPVTEAKVSSKQVATAHECNARPPSRDIRKSDICRPLGTLYQQALLVNVQDKQGNTALHLGARSRCPELLSVLLQGEGSAAAHLKNNDGQLPLHLASKSGSVEAVKALLQAQPSTVTAKDLRGFTAQEWAAKRGHQVLSFTLAEPSGDLWIGLARIK